MKSKEIRELSVQEIDKKLRDTRQALLQTRLRKETGQVENPTDIRIKRRSIARLETILSEKKRAESIAS